MKIKNITKNIVLVTIPDRKKLAMTFLRFQEYYESPEFRGSIFTVGMFKDWYSRTQKGGFTYSDDWSGFNIPSYILEPFIKGLFDPLTDLEAELVETFRYRRGRFYIIGVSKADTTLDHEISHGLYYTSRNYREAVDKYITENKSDFEQLREHIVKMMYHEAVIQDEVHAYGGSDYEYLVESGIHLDKNHHDCLAVLRAHYLAKGKV